MVNACLEITSPTVLADDELPQAITTLRTGATVLDLGSGDGAYSFLAATAVGESGCVIGVVTTPEMISQARANAVQNRYCNVSFRLGELEYLPVADQTADAIISRYGLRPSYTKTQVFREAFRALKPGGHLAIVAMVVTQVLPEDVEEDDTIMLDDIEDMLRAAGFARIHSQRKQTGNGFCQMPAAKRTCRNMIAPALIEAVKPA